MAQASKRRPWVVEMQPAGTDGWYHVDAYRDEDEAEANASLMRKRAPAATFRVRDTRTEQPHSMCQWFEDERAFAGGAR